MSQITIEGESFYVHDAGAGHPILFVHGFPLDHTMWALQLRYFSESYRVIAPDLRGFGKSSGAQQTVTMEQFADDLAALLDALEIDEPVTFCGLSMGGYIGWQFVDRHPQKVARLILCDTRAAGDAAEIRENRLALADRVVEEGPDFVVDGMLEKLFAETTRVSRPELIDQTRMVITKTNPQAIAGASRGMAERPDMTHSLREIHLPTQVICGTEDILTKPDEMQIIADQIPKARMALIPGAGHMSPLEKPDDVNQQLSHFLGETDV